MQGNRGREGNDPCEPGSRGEPFVKVNRGAKELGMLLRGEIPAIRFFGFGFRVNRCYIVGLESSPDYFKTGF